MAVIRSGISSLMQVKAYDADLQTGEGTAKFLQYGNSYLTRCSFNYFVNIVLFLGDTNPCTFLCLNEMLSLAGRFPTLYCEVLNGFAWTNLVVLHFQGLTTATSPPIPMGTAATSATQHPTSRGCVAAPMG